MPTLAKPCHRQPPLHSGAPRTTLNKSEQTRTNLNAAKPPDQIGIPPNRPQHPPKKTNPNTAAAHPPPFLHRPPSVIPASPSPPFLGCPPSAIPAPPSPSFLRPSSVIPAPLFRHSCAPLPSFLRRQEPTQHPRPSPIHPSPLPGGRLGGGWEAAIVLPRSLCHPHTRAQDPSFAPPLAIRAPPRHSRPPSPFAPLRVIPAPLVVILAPLFRHSCAPLVIPAQAGTRRSPAFGAHLNIPTARPSRLCAAAGCSAPGRAPPTA